MYQAVPLCEKTGSGLNINYENWHVMSHLVALLEFGYFLVVLYDRLGSSICFSL